MKSRVVAGRIQKKILWEYYDQDPPRHGPWVYRDQGASLGSICRLAAVDPHVNFPSCLYFDIGVKAGSGSLLQAVGYFDMYVSYLLKLSTVQPALAHSFDDS